MNLRFRPTPEGAGKKPKPINCARSTTRLKPAVMKAASEAADARLPRRRSRSALAERSAVLRSIVLVVFVYRRRRAPLPP
eukprot:6211448-Pleurochrysis_carterae.AAC.3